MHLVQPYSCNLHYRKYTWNTMSKFSILSYRNHIPCDKHNRKLARYIGCCLDKSCCANQLLPRTVEKLSDHQKRGDYHRGPDGKNPLDRGLHRKSPSRTPCIFCTSVPWDSNPPRISEDYISNTTDSFQNPSDEISVVLGCTYLERIS